MIIPEEEASQYNLFKQHQDKFMTLLEAGLFDIKGASGTVHFDGYGNIRKVECTMVRLYTINLTNSQ